MRGRILLLAGLVLAGSCDSASDPAFSYRHPRDQLIAALGGRLFGEQPCFRTIKGYPGRLPDADCYRLDPPQRLRGIWARGYEESSFYRDRTSTPTEATPRPDVWLDLQPGAFSPAQRRLIPGACAKSCLVYLDFIGRRTSVEGHYGAMGLSKHILVVDRVIEVKPLPEPANG